MELAAPVLLRQKRDLFNFCKEALRASTYDGRGCDVGTTSDPEAIASRE